MAQALKTAVRSFYSGQCYGELVFRRTGIGLPLIVLLTCLITGLFFLALLAGGQYGQIRNALGDLPGKADAMPAVIINGGKLTIDKPVPYTVALGEGADEVHIVIDTNYTFSGLDALENYMRRNRIALLATGDRVITRDVSKNESRPAQISDTLKISDLKGVRDFTITHDDWRALGETVKSWGMTAIVTVAAIGMFIGMLFANFVGTVFSAVAIMALDLVMNLGIEFPAAMRLAAAFRIPVTVLSMLPILVGMNPLLGLSGWLVWAIYLIFAIWSVKLWQGGKA